MGLAQGHVPLACMEDSRNIWKGRGHRQMVDHKPLMCHAPEVGLTSMLHALGGPNHPTCRGRLIDGTVFLCLSLGTLPGGPTLELHAAWLSLCVHRKMQNGQCAP